MTERFRSAQDRAVAFIVEGLGPAYGARLPSSNREWVDICNNCGLHKIRQVDGTEIYVHGFGIELILDGVTIDFDWGNSGEPDGFDAWRLWDFVLVNRLAVACDSHSEIRSWLEEAAALGELTEDGQLYESPAHRAKSPAA